jgi:MFS superfamily sulfate permease-like transporter
MNSIPLSWLPLVGLLAIPSAVAFALGLEPVAVLAILNTVLIVVAVRIMFGSADEQYLPARLTGN